MTQTVSPTPRQQLSLAVQLRDDATFGNYFPAPAQALLLETLERQLQPAGEPALYVYGGRGSGKSHLLQACCHAAGGEALYLPLADLRDFPPQEVLHGVERAARVCLDDLQEVLADADWEEALFHLWNRARERDCRLLLAADVSPRGLPAGLADLRSRLSSAMVFQLASMDDELKVEVLCFRAQRRGLQLSPEVSRFIVRRAPRDLEQLLILLRQLDDASLSAQRRLSIPFVKQVLGW